LGATLGWVERGWVEHVESRRAEKAPMAQGHEPANEHAGPHERVNPECEYRVRNHGVPGPKTPTTQIRPICPI